MNIFISDLNPNKSALNLDDKRVKHMPKECFEMISIALYKNMGYAIAPFIIWNREHRAFGYKFEELFTNKCTNWVCRSRENIWWLWCHTQALLNEYQYRFNQVHYLFDSFLSIQHYIPEATKAPKSFANASGQESNDIVDNYKKCLNIKWFETDEIRPVIWTNRYKPNWANPILGFTQVDLFHKKFEQGDLFLGESNNEELPF